MKRIFKIRCNRANSGLVKSVVNTYSQMAPVNPLKRGNGYNRGVTVNDANYDYTEIQFKCSRQKLGECRLVLREMCNAGLLSSATEIW